MYHQSIEMTMIHETLLKQQELIITLGRKRKRPTQKELKIALQILVLGFARVIGVGGGGGIIIFHS